MALKITNFNDGKKRAGVVKKCLNCGKEYYVVKTREQTSKYCSVQCGGEYRHKNGIQQKGEYKKCLTCGKEYYCLPNRVRYAKFCSKKCFHDHPDTYTKKICVVCGKEYRIRNYPGNKEYIEKSKHCSPYCAKISSIDVVEKRKRKNLERIVRRGTYSSTTLRKYVFQNKEKKCEVCGYNEYDFCLDVHHKDKNPKNNELDNLIVLCVICHRKLHKGLVTLEGD